MGSAAQLNPAGGRRRAGLGIVTIATGLVIAAGLAGCSIGGSKQTDDGASSEPAVTTIALRSDSNDLQLPLDQFMPTDQELAQIQAAFQLRLRQCVGQYGLDYNPEVSANPVVRGRNARRYGVTDEAQVTLYGYHLPPEANGRKPAQQPLSAEVETVLSGKGTSTINGRAIPTGGCVAKVQAELNQNPSGTDENLAQRLSGEAFSRSQADSRVRATVNRWSACMKEKGFNYATPDNAIGDPKFTGGDAASKTEINTAKTDVACKRQVNLIGVWAAVESAYQVRSIGQNEEPLNALRRSQAEQVKNAARLSSLPQ